MFKCISSPLWSIFFHYSYSVVAIFQPFITVFSFILLPYIFAFLFMLSLQKWHLLNIHSECMLWEQTIVHIRICFEIELEEKRFLFKKKKFLVFWRFNNEEIQSHSIVLLCFSASSSIYLFNLNMIFVLDKDLWQCEQCKKRTITSGSLPYFSTCGAHREQKITEYVKVLRRFFHVFFFVFHSNEIMCDCHWQLFLIDKPWTEWLHRVWLWESWEQEILVKRIIGNSQSRKTIVFFFFQQYW